MSVFTKKPANKSVELTASLAFCLRSEFSMRSFPSFTCRSRAAVHF